MSNIGFPGLGLSFTINKTAFTVFGLRVQWYALIIVVGILAALFGDFASRIVHLKKIQEKVL